jgi:S1-C subfamily serine protease
VQSSKRLDAQLPAFTRMSRLNRSPIPSFRFWLAVCVLASSARAQAPGKQGMFSSLDELSGAIESLVTHVSPSVVRIEVTRFGSTQEEGRTDLVVGREEAVGSGVIIDPDGYILTNAHVV